MDPIRESESSLPPGHARSSSWLGQWQRLSPLARDIVIVLVVKVLVLCAIWFTFFRTPVARHMTMEPSEVEQQVAGPGAHPEPAHAVR